MNDIIRINIHYTLDKATSDFAKILNQNLIALCKNEIDLNKNRPHISLLRCEVGYNDLPKLIAIVKEFNSEASNKTIELNPPVVKNAFVSLFVKDKTAFKKDCDNLLSQLQGMVNPAPFTISEGSTPHITIGFTYQEYKIKEFLTTITTIPALTVGNLRVSKVGKRGVVEDDLD